MNSPKLVKFTIEVCENCLNLEPGTCHMPGCCFCRMTANESSVMLNILNIRPIVDGIQLPWEEE